MGSRIVLSIIIANWNSRDLVRALLTSIYAHKPEGLFQVIVIDNGSRDGSQDMVEGEFPQVRLIKNIENLGYARANNQGYSIAQGEFILLLGSDTVVIDDSLDRMVNYLRSHQEASAVTCRLLNPDKSPQLSCRRFPGLWDAIATYLSLHWLAHRYTMGDFDFYRTQKVGQPSATCLMIRRELLERIGLFDERYTILYNDVDLCQRIHVAGMKIVYLSDAEVIHHGSQSTMRATPALRLEMYRNILDYYHQYVGARARWILLPILFLRLCIVTRSTIAFRLFFRPAPGGGR